MLGEQTEQRGLWEADRMYLDYVGKDTFYGLVASLRGQLFRDVDFAELYCLDNGRTSVPPSLLATALLLQTYDKVSDAEAKARADFDIRWKVALGIEIEDRPFAKSTLQVFRGQLILHDQVREVFERSLRLARETGYLKRRSMRVALDTTYILGRGAVKDTYNLLADGIARLMRALAAVERTTIKAWAEAQGYQRYLGSSVKGEAAIDWSSKRERRKLLAEIVADADRLFVTGVATGYHPQTHLLASGLARSPTLTYHPSCQRPRLIPSVDSGLAYGLLIGLLPAPLMPLAGWAVDRWGARRLILWGMVVLGVGAILYPGRQVAPVLYLSLAFVGVGGLAGSRLPFAAAVNNWFRRRRAMAMAVMILPSTAASFFFESLRSAVTDNLMVASLAVPATVLVLAWPLSRLLKNRPEDHGQHPDGIVPDLRGEAGSGRSVSGETLAPDYAWREALRTRFFWLLLVGGTVTSASSAAMFLGTLVMRNQGFAEVHSSATLWLDGVFTVAFVLVGGWMGDRFPIHRVMFGFGLLEALAVGVLAFGGTLPTLYVSAMLAGIGAGGSAPLAYAAYGVYFGRRNFATITGISLMLLTLEVGRAFGVLSVGLLLSITGVITIPSVVIALIGAARSLAFLFLGNPRPSPAQG